MKVIFILKTVGYIFFTLVIRVQKFPYIAVYKKYTAIFTALTYMAIQPYDEAMKIEGPSKAGKAAKTGKAGKTQKADGSFGDMVAQATQESQSAAATQSIAKVDALLAVQGVESATDRGAKRHMRERGDKILRQLDHIRLGILTGRLNAGELIDIADVVASHREQVDDPEMSAVLDEIDLRAQIEIAKMKKSMSLKN